MSEPPSENIGSLATLPEEAGDYTIFLVSDGYKRTLPWIIKDYEEKGAFTGEQKLILSERFNLCSELVDLLSLYVGNCLDTETSVGFYKLTKSKAVQRGHEVVRRALRDLKAGKTDEKIRSMLADISGIFSSSPKGMDVERLIANENADLKVTLESLLQTLDAIALTVPDDKRTGRDSRRILIVEHCCYVWEDAGHKITYTTFPDRAPHDRRGGQLFNLIDTVVKMVTQPSQSINGETLKADVDRLVKKHGWNKPQGERPDFMKEEPEFGKEE